LTDPRARCSDSDFVRLFEEIGPTKLSKHLGITTKSVYGRRKSLERKIGRQITGPEHPKATRHGVAHPQRVELQIDNGHILVGSDAHLWPGPKSTAMRAFIKFCRDVKPKAVILNGDVLDFPQISRHPPIGYQHHPTVQQEIEHAQDVLSELELASFKARRIFSLGNHDQRYEVRLATVAPEYVGIHGYSLKDWFPAWEPCWRAVINGDTTIKHRLSGGVNATRNNVLRSGHHTVTGHLHSANVRGFTDYRGTRWGVDTGCLADPEHRAFVDYTEDGPKDWRSAFCLLTYHKGVLLQPELILVHDEKHVDFRGELIKA
jgi:hypothetical protein